MILARCIKDSISLKKGRIYRVKMGRELIEVYGRKIDQEEWDEGEYKVTHMPRFDFKEYFSKKLFPNP